MEALDIDLQLAIIEQEKIKTEYYLVANEINKALVEIKHKKAELYKLNCKLVEAMQKVSDIENDIKQQNLK